MIAIAEVISTVVEALLSIDEIYARFGPTGVYAQASDEISRDLSEAVNAMQTPALMVVYDGFGPGAIGDVTKLSHRLTAIMRLDTPAEYHQAAQEFLYGVPAAGDGLPFITSQFHPDLELSGVPTFGRLLDGEGTELWQITFTLIEQGG